MSPTGSTRVRAWPPLVLAAVVGATHLGYPAYAVIAARRVRPPSTLGPFEQSLVSGLGPGPGPPSITVVVCALDEEAVIGAKVDDARAQLYGGQVVVMVVADGSTDGTAAVAEAHGALVLFHPVRRGKSHAVNRGMAAVTTELVCLTDANTLLAPGSLAALAEAFVDTSVAVVAGAKRVVGSDPHARGEGLYWRVESAILAGESVFGATMGAPGEVCGIRTATFTPIPAGVVNDDYHTVCDALIRGLKVVYAPGAEAVEVASTSLSEEFERRTRIAAGTWQTTLGHLGLARPSRGRTAVAFWGHRVLRSLVVPPLLPLVWVLSWRARERPWVRALFTVQTVGYVAAALGSRWSQFPLPPAFQFAFTNSATLVGAWRHLTGRQPVAWLKPDRHLTEEGT